MLNASVDGPGSTASWPRVEVSRDWITLMRRLDLKPQGTPARMPTQAGYRSRMVVTTARTARQTGRGSLWQPVTHSESVRAREGIRNVTRQYSREATARRQSVEQLWSRAVETQRSQPKFREARIRRELIETLAIGFV